MVKLTFQIVFVVKLEEHLMFVTKQLVLSK